MASDDIWILGITMTKFGKRPDDDVVDLAAEAALGALAGHAAAGMSRKDLKELGEGLDSGQAGLVVVGVSDMGAKIEGAMTQADNVDEKQLQADTAEIQKDAEAAG